MKCSNGKIQYNSEQEALNALIDHRARFHHSPNSGPINVYKCTICEFWHFTSRGLRHSILEDQEQKEKARILSASYDWERKFKK